MIWIVLTPNSITISRIFISPLFAASFFLTDIFQSANLISVVLVWIIFALIEITDVLDGKWARMHNMESERGKLLDPFADSLSRLTYFVCFAAADIMPVWVLLLILYRDLGVSFIRQVLSDEGVTLGARMSGKVKAWVYAVSGFFGISVFSLHKLLILQNALTIVSSLCYFVFIATGIVAVWSFIDYVRASSISKKL